MTDATLTARAYEFFTLHEAERDARALPDGPRTSLRHALMLAFQKRESAEALWPRGCCAEAMVLARASLDLGSAALESFEALEGVAKPSWLGRSRAVADDARKQIAGARLPELELEVSPADEATFTVMISAVLEIERLTGLGLAPPGDIARARRARIVTLAICLAFAVALIAFWMHTPLVLHATGSQALGANLGENAVDGNVKTAWILADKQTGWLDVTLGGKHSVKSIRVLPANPPYNDRNVKESHIEAFLGDRRVKALDFTFREPVGTEPDWTEVPLGVKCDRIRITPLNTYKLSPAIAEVEIR